MFKQLAWKKEQFATLFGPRRPMSKGLNFISAIPEVIRNKHHTIDSKTLANACGFALLSPDHLDFCGPDALLGFQNPLLAYDLIRHIGNIPDNLCQISARPT